MFRSSITFAKKISKLHRCEFAAGRLIGSMKNKQTIAFAAEKPSVTVRTVVNLSFSDCHAGTVLPKNTIRQANDRSHETRILPRRAAYLSRRRKTDCVRTLHPDPRHHGSGRKRTGSMRSNMMAIDGSSKGTGSAFACSPAMATTGAVGFRSLPKPLYAIGVVRSSSTARPCCWVLTAPQISTVCTPESMTMRSCSTPSTSS